MVKHKPDSPLPWRETRTALYANTREPKRVMSKADAAYVVHAAIAYPEMVSLLHKVVLSRTKISPVAAALLKKLGER